MVDKTLLNYIIDGISKGYTKDELKKILLENGWSEKELSEAFIIASRMSQKQIAAQKTQQPNQIISQRRLSQTSLTPIEKDRLVGFMKMALSRDINRQDIKFALIKKGWSEEKVEEAFRIVDSERTIIKEEAKPEESFKVESSLEINAKMILSYILGFILITIVVGATLSLLFYVIAITNYEVLDPNTGTLVKGACLEEKCTDMKEYAFKKVGLHKDSTDRGKLWTALIVGAAIALLIVLLFIFVSFKTALLWIFNLLYFIFIAYIAYLWISFNYVVAG